MYMKKILLVGCLLLLGTACQTTTTVLDTPEEPNNQEEPVKTDEQVVAYATKLIDRSIFGYQVELPEAMKTEIQTTELHQDTLRAYYLGPTQSDGTEMYDGYTLTITNVKLDTTDGYQKLAKTEVESAKNNGQVLKELHPVTIAGIEGVSFQSEGLGIFDQIFLPIPNTTDAWHIITFAPDPKNFGYQEKINNILESLKVVK